MVKYTNTKIKVLPSGVSGEEGGGEDSDNEVDGVVNNGICILA